MNGEHESEIIGCGNLVAEAISAAEDIPDPLDGLVERVVANPARPSRAKCWSGSQR
jgi:hypothetical protein